MITIDDRCLSWPWWQERGLCWVPGRKISEELE